MAEFESKMLGVIENMDKDFAYVSLFKETDGVPDYIADIPIKYFAENNVSGMRDGSVLEFRVYEIKDEDKNFKLSRAVPIRIIPIKNLSPEEIAKEETRLRDAFK